MVGFAGKRTPGTWWSEWVSREAEGGWGSAVVG